MLKRRSNGFQMLERRLNGCSSRVDPGYDVIKLTDPGLMA